MGGAEDIYQKICMVCRHTNLAPSIRSERAIRRYWAAAQRWFVPDARGRNTALIALDYAVAQRILPKITGAGEKTRLLLEELQKVCRQENLCGSAGKLDEILQRGQEGMGYYSFF